MNESPESLPSIVALKEAAKCLRAESNAGGEKITHSKSLELLAHQYGYKDWNTLHAAACNGPPLRTVASGAKTRGRYLGQPFEGEILDVRKLTVPGRFRVTVHFDEPVDVVTFGSFSNFRQRVSCTLDSKGKTTEKTSNGDPHMVLDL